MSSRWNARGALAFAVFARERWESSSPARSAQSSPCRTEGSTTWERARNNLLRQPGPGECLREGQESQATADACRGNSSSADGASLLPGPFLAAPPWMGEDFRLPISLDARAAVKIVSMKLALMITCLGDVLRPKAGQATVQLLRRLGHEIDFPADQTCCGQPFYNSGFADLARAQAKHTIDVFRDGSTVVVPSGCVRGDGQDRVPAFVSRRSRVARTGGGTGGADV